MLNAGYKRISPTLRDYITQKEQTTKRSTSTIRIKQYSELVESDNSDKSMRLVACCFAMTFVGVALGCGRQVGDPSDDTMQRENPLTMNLVRYSRGLDKDLQLARLLLTRQHILNSNNKRNSELINSLLGLPKNINNIGK